MFSYLISYNDGDGYRRKYADLLSRGEYGRYQERLLEAARHNHSRKLRILFSLFDEFHLEQRLAPFTDLEKLLPTLIIFSDSSESDCFELAADRLQKMFFVPIPGSKQTVLHIAVARMNLKVRAILERVKDMGEPTFLQYLHSPLDSQADRENLADTCMEAELPLSIAAWNGDLEMAMLLTEHGCKLSKQNHMGDNVFHTIVKVMSKNKDSISAQRSQQLLRVFHYLRGYKLGKTTTSSQQQLSLLFNAQNDQGFTPLTLSAKLAGGIIYEQIINSMNVYKFLDNVDGVSNRYLYDVTDIDSALTKGKSVMEMISTHGYGTGDLQYFTETSPVLDMIRQKWQRYRKYFFAWLLCHAIACPAPVVFIYAATAPNYCMQLDSGKDIVLFVWQIYFLAYALVSVIFEVIQLHSLRRAGILTHRHLINPVSNGPFHLLLLLFALADVSAVILMILCHQMANVAVTIATICGWMFTLYFTRAVKTFSYFTAILLEALFHDLGRMVLVYGAVLVPFSVGMTLEFQESHKELFGSLGSTSFLMFKFAIGLDEPPDFRTAVHPSAAQVMYIVYLALSYLLLLNMLIALLSETTIRISNYRDTHWHLQKLNIILYLERRLPSRLKCICGTTKTSKLFPSASDVALNLPNGFSEHHLPSTMETAVSGKVSSKRVYLEVKKPSPYQDYLSSRSAKSDSDAAASEVSQRRQLVYTMANPPYRAEADTREFCDLNHTPQIS